MRGSFVMAGKYSMRIVEHILFFFNGGKIFNAYRRTCSIPFLLAGKYFPAINMHIH